MNIQCVPIEEVYASHQVVGGKGSCLIGPNGEILSRIPDQISDLEGDPAPVDRPFSDDLKQLGVVADIDHSRLRRGGMRA
jgi:hypothetical protein